MRRLLLTVAIPILGACASSPEEGGVSRFTVVRDLNAVPEAHRRTARSLVAAADALAAGDRERAAGQLLIAASSSPQPHLAAHLRAAHRAWITGAELDALEQTLLALGDRPLIAPFHAEPGPGHPLRAIQVGLVVDREQDLLDRFLRNLHQVETWLELGDRGPREPRDKLVIARVLARAGDVAPGSMHTRLPADPARRAEVGSVSVFWSTMLRERWWATEVAPAAEAVLVPQDAARVSPGAHLRWYATRFGTYQLGPRHEREHFGEDWGPLVIAKADVLAALVRSWLVGEGVADPLEEEQAACTLVAMAFRALADARLGEAPAAHERASGLELAWLLHEGAISFQEGWVAVDVTATLRAARALAQELATIAVQRDRGRASALLARGDGLPAEVEAAIARVMAIPRVERQPEFR